MIMKIIDRWLNRLRTDDDGIDKLEDRFATNTWLEIYLLWIAICLTVLVVVTILYYVGKLLP